MIPLLFNWSSVSTLSQDASQAKKPILGGTIGLAKSVSIIPFFFISKYVSIIPDPDNLHENKSPYLVDLNPKISYDKILNKSVPIIYDSQNPDSISNSNIEKSGSTTPPNPS